MIVQALALMLVAAAPDAAPSGRPPVGPLERFEPRLYDLRFSVRVGTVLQFDASQRRNYNLADAPIVLPLIYQSSYSSTDPESVTAQLSYSPGGEDTAITSRMHVDPGKPFNTHLLVLPIEKFTGQSLRFQVEYRVQVWSSRLKDEQAAAAIAWPREWPEEVRDGLKPQMFIESSDPIFASAVERISKGQLRNVPPYLAAKDLLRACIDELRLTGSGTNRGEHGELQGMDMVGAKKMVTDGIGGPHDLVCVCVAMLRAAGIPARPVVGVYENEEKQRHDFVTWAEFFLPDVGWIPFDPVAMKGKAVRHRDVHDPWPEFGTMKELNKRIPMAYGFLPSATVQVPQNPAIWAWDPRPGGDPSSDQDIAIVITNRGRGTEDPKVRAE